MLDIDKDNYFSRLQQARSEELANYVEITTRPLTPADNPEEVFRSGENIVLSPGEDRDITVFYKEPPVLTAGASAFIVDATGGVISIVSVEYFAWGAEVSLSNTDSIEGAGKISITGTPLRVSGEETIKKQDDTSILINGMLKYTYPGNPLIQSTEMAERIAERLLASYKDFRKDVSLEWRGDPSLELGDDITVPVYQRGNTLVTGIFRVFKNTIAFDGSLTGFTEARKIDEVTNDIFETGSTEFDIFETGSTEFDIFEDGE